VRSWQRRQRTSKGLLDIYHLPRTCLHEPTPIRPRPFQPLPTTDHPHVLQVALVAGHNLNRLHGTTVLPMIALHIYHLKKVVEVAERGRGRDIVDEEECVRAEIRSCPKTAIFFLSRSVGQREKVGLAVYVSGYRVRVLCGGSERFCDVEEARYTYCWIVSVEPVSLVIPV